jgi:hypothetical protein
LEKFRNPTQLGRFARRPAKSIPMAMLRANSGRSTRCSNLAEDTFSICAQALQ